MVKITKENALHYHQDVYKRQGFVGGVDYAVLAVIEADVFANLGVAVIVLREEGAEAAPAARCV